MNDEVEAIAAHLKDAVARRDADTAGRILTDHLGELMMHDVAWTCATMAEIDIRMAVKYPALAVAHPHRQQLVRHYPRDAQLPLISSRDRPQSWLYGMAFVRATGRVRLAQEYANRLAANLDHVSSAGGPPLSRGHEWLVRFQLGLTRLAAGELQQATEELGIASRLVRFPGRDQISDAARLTFGYLALIAALSGATALARHHLARSEGDSLVTGGPLWGLLAAARAIVEVEENTPESDEAVAALELIDDQDLFWPYALLAQTRHAELHNRPLDALATVRLAESLRKPEPGSFAHDILVARRIEALVILGRLGAARATYEDRAVDAPHCQLAFLALLLAENNFNGLERATNAMLTWPRLSPAQRVQAQALGALGLYARDGTIPDYIAPGLAYALSQRAHRRIALMFPPAMREALAPFLKADAVKDWEEAIANVRQWTSASDAEVPRLTRRERAMLTQIDRDHSYSEIAEKEHVSINTVKYHLKALYKKLGASTRADAIASARRWGLLDGPFDER